MALRFLSGALSLTILAAAGCGGDDDGSCVDGAPCACDGGRSGLMVCPGLCMCEGILRDAGTPPPADGGRESDAGATRDGGPPDPSCYAHASMSECTTAGCAWEQAGCSPPIGIVRAGACLDGAAQTCGADGDCASGTLCEIVWENPCLGLPCDACGGEIGYCFPEDEALRLCSIATSTCALTSDTACPERPARQGTVCTDEGLTCYYCLGGNPGRASGGVDTASCTDGSWVPSRTSC